MYFLTLSHHNILKFSTQVEEPNFGFKNAEKQQIGPAGFKITLMAGFGGVFLLIVRISITQPLEEKRCGELV